MKKSVIFAGIVLSFTLFSCDTIQEKVEDKVNETIDNQIEKADSLIKKELDKPAQELDTLMNKTEKEINKKINK